MVAEQGCATTHEHDPVTSAGVHDTSVHSFGKCDVGISKDLYAITESMTTMTPAEENSAVDVVEEPVCFGNLTSNGEIIWASNARNLTTNVNESVNLTQDEFAATCADLKLASEWSSLPRLGTLEQDGIHQGTTVDWTTQGVMKQQGQCGSCWVS